MRIGKNLDTSYYGIATSKSSGLHASINQALLNLQNMRVSITIHSKTKWNKFYSFFDHPPNSEDILYVSNVDKNGKL